MCNQYLLFFILLPHLSFLVGQVQFGMMPLMSVNELIGFKNKSTKRGIQFNDFISFCDIVKIRDLLYKILSAFVALLK